MVCCWCCWLNGLWLFAWCLFGFCVEFCLFGVRLFSVCIVSVGVDWCLLIVLAALFLVYFGF